MFHSQEEEAEGDNGTHDGHIENIGPLREGEAPLQNLPRCDKEGPKEGAQAKGINHHGPRAIPLEAPFPI